MRQCADDGALAKSWVRPTRWRDADKTRPASTTGAFAGDGTARFGTLAAFFIDNRPN
jgi:hypothetical protein